MSKIMEDMRNEVARETAKETSREMEKRFLEMGKLSIEEIAKGTGLAVKEVKELEMEVMQLA